MAAGVDKNATWFESLGLIGFGAVEVGTVTAEPQPGNERPRIFRMPADRALLNKMGFPNTGATAVAERLSKNKPSTTGPVIGVNVGKSRKASLAEAAQDYRATVRRVAPFADYLVINVSSPNTPGLREMQAASYLQPLIEGIRSELADIGSEVPIMVKISPDVDDDDIDAIADLAVSLSLDGIVAVNTTVHRDHLVGAYENLRHVDGGGVSGAPLKKRALEVLRRLYARVGGRLILVSVGGIESPQDAWQRILAGATLVQAHTGFVYGGPAWPRRVNRLLARRVREAGKSSISELVGADADDLSLREGGSELKPLSAVAPGNTISKDIRRLAS